MQLDLSKIQKIMLINSLNHRQEHKTVILQLAALSPEDLFALTPQQILERFLASAGHLGGRKGAGGDQIALLADIDTGGVKLKFDASKLTCFHCNQIGHIKSSCPKLKSSAVGKKKFGGKKYGRN
jgi:hypothetical protein